MDGLTFVVLILFVAAVMFRILTNPIVKNMEGKATEKLVVKTKQCPPHQWGYKSIIDENGTFQGEVMICKICGPINTGGSSNEG